MTNYTCLECNEEFDLQVNCVIHHFEKKHEEFEIIGTDAKITIKTPDEQDNQSTD